MQLTRRFLSLTISAASSRPHALFHYSKQASCIVTTTNFLAVYKAVTQNHTEQGVEVGGCRGAGAELGGLLGRAAGLQTRCQFYTAEHNGGGERRSCLPVAMLNRKYQKYFDLCGGDIWSAWLSLK